MRTLDMTCIRHLNLFEKVTGIRTQSCFIYNNFIIFAVPASFISRAIGEEGNNVKRLSMMLRKKIKIIALPRENEYTKFILDLISPLTIDEVQVTPDEVIVSGSRQSKAVLIGRNKVRYMELKKIVEDVFNKQLKII